MSFRHTGQRVFATEQMDSRLRAGLVGHWIGGGSGLTWFDRSGYNNHGTLTGGPLWTLGEGGKRNALSFDGTDDYVQISRASGLFDFTNEIKTLSLWIRPNVNNINQTLLGKGVDANTGWELIVLSSGLVAYTNNGGAFSDCQSTTVVPTTSWTHVALTVDGTTERLYINGRQEDTGTTNNITNTTTDLFIGQRETNGLRFNGLIDDVRIWNRALSAAEITLLFKDS
jgi:hypothetical protein